jgi:ribosomal protein S18 acetylase RimI-like enzyme
MEQRAADGPSILIREAEAGDLEQIADIMVRAFPAKFGTIFGPRDDLAREIVTQVLSTSYASGKGAFVAQEGSETVGMLLLQYRGQPESGLDIRAIWRILREHLPLYCWPRLLLGLTLPTHRVGADEAYILAIAVRAAARGRGVGTQLIETAEAWARDRHMERLGLHVSNKNPRAQALYERLGFVVRHTERSLLSGLVFHLTSFHYMTKVLGNE